MNLEFMSPYMTYIGKGSSSDFLFELRHQSSPDNVQLGTPVFVMKRIGFTEINDINRSRGGVGIFTGLAALPLSSLHLKHAPIVPVSDSDMRISCARPMNIAIKIAPAIILLSRNGSLCQRQAASHQVEYRPHHLLKGAQPVATHHLVMP